MSVLTEIPSAVRTPNWEYLIAHHFPNRYSRTLELRVGGHSYHLCARCTGQLVGFLGVLILFLASPWFADVAVTPTAALILGLCPSASMADWLAQTTRSRESTNPRRVVSGIMLGAAFGGLIAYGISLHGLLFVGSLAVLGIYLALASLALSRTGSLARVVAEHFP